MKVGSGSFVFHIIPAQDVPSNDKVAPQDLLEKRLHDKSASLLTQVSGMFVAATSMFSSLAKDAAEASGKEKRLMFCKTEKREKKRTYSTAPTSH
jgi:hypothetical protein